MTNYFDKPYLSNSKIKDILVSIDKFLQPKTEPTKAMQFGSLFHTYFLEPEKFDNEYFVLTENFDLRKKEDKEKYALIRSQNEFKTCIELDEYNLMLNMKNSILAHPLAYIFQGAFEVEKELYFNYYNVDCKSKLDFINHDLKIIIDLKTIDSIEKYERVTLYENYIQSVFYRLAVKEIYGLDYKFIFCYVEKKAPYSCVFVSCENYDRYNFEFDKIIKAMEIYKDYLSDFIEFTGYKKELVVL